MWLCGATEAGKTKYVEDTYPGYYEKDKSKYWNGYTQQPVVLLDDVELDDKYLLGPLKRWVQHKPFPAEDKFGQMR